MKRLLRAILLCPLSALCAYAQACPGCFFNTSTAALAGHGAAPDGSGRRVINIYIDSSWASGGSTNTKVWNGIAAAVAAWNGATDTSGNTTGYYFQVNQTGGTGSADIIVSRNDSFAGTIIGAQTNATAVPRTIQISPDPVFSVATDYTDIGGLSSHEFGHAIGLDDTGGNSLCTGFSATIMQHLNPDFTAAFKTVQASDVALANTHLTSIASCSRDVNQSAKQDTAPTSGGGGDPPSCSSGCWDANGNCLTSCTAGDGGGGSSPIVIDTRNEGFHLTSAANGVMFDFYGTGAPIKISWTNAQYHNGWLALDRNGNGTIDSAQELFGNITAPQPSSTKPNGFLALSEYDGNRDGVIDARDPVFSRLRIWIDSNHNGRSEPEELITLSAAGIAAIPLQYHDSRYCDEFGNTFRFAGSILDAKGSKDNTRIYDVFLRQAQ